MLESVTRGAAGPDGRRRTHIALTVLAGIGASALMYWITAHGPEVTPDSVQYLEASRSLLSGNGLSVGTHPLVRFPPVYPILLGGAGLFTADVLAAARVLDSIFFGLNLVLLSICVQKGTDYDGAATACVILVFLSSAPVISVHAMAMSEAPFIALSLAGLLFLAQHLVHPRTRTLLAASLLVGLAAATRYVGIVLFPCVVLALLLLDARPLKRRIVDVASFAAIACLPLAGWLLRNALTVHTTTGRAFALHPFGFDQAKQLIKHLYNFVLPIGVSGWVKALHVAAASTLLALASFVVYRKGDVWNGRRRIRLVLPSIFFIYALSYVALLVVSISLFDAATPVDDRILLPVLLALAAAIICVVWSFSRLTAQRSVWYGFVGLVLVSVTINASRSISKASEIHRDGEGYSSPVWEHSELLAYVADLPDETHIYSNGPDAIRFFADREATWIPRPVFSGTAEENPHFQQDIERMVEECADGRAVVVYFTNITWRWYILTPEELMSEYDVPVARRLRDGVIMGAAPP